MNLSVYSVYQGRSQFWMRAFLVLVPVFVTVLILYADENSATFVMGIVGLILSLVGLLSAWLIKHYYAFYEQALQRFEKLPVLASWHISGASWNDYGHIELEHRKRGFLKYILWSPLIVAGIAFMVWAEVDELTFDTNLLWYGLGGYSVFIILLYFQMKNSALKTSADPKSNHSLVLKSTGVVVDDKVTFWGRVIADEHKTLTDSLLGALFLVSDEHRGLINSTLLREGGLHYLLITYKTDENNQLDLYLPVPETQANEIGAVAENIATEPTLQGATSPGKFKTMKYIKIVGGLVVVGSLLVWGVTDGLPLYHQYKSENYFDDGVKAYNRENYDSALYFYKKAIDEYAEMPEAYLNVGVIFLKKEQTDSALRYYDLALQYKPDFDLAWSNRGALLYDLNQFDASNQAFQNYYRLKPDDHDYDLNLGDNYYSLSKFDSALLYYQRAYAENKKTSILCYMIGLTKFQKQSWADAVVALQESISMDSTNADSYQLLGDSYAMLGKEVEAIKFHEMANLLKPK